MPTSDAAAAPKAWENAVRCGIAVIGTQRPMTSPMTGADGEPGEDPIVTDDLLVQQRADDGHEHAYLREVHAAPRGLG